MTFNTGSGASGPIRALTDNNDIVVMLQCCDESKPLWDTPVAETPKLEDYRIIDTETQNTAPQADLHKSPPK